MLHCTVVEGSFNTLSFIDFIHDLLNKMNSFPAPRSVIVMNNCAIHKAEKITGLVRSRYRHFPSCEHCSLISIAAGECASSIYRLIHLTSIQLSWLFQSWRTDFVVKGWMLEDMNQWSISFSFMSAALLHMSAGPFFVDASMIDDYVSVCIGASSIIFNIIAQWLFFAHEQWWDDRISTRILKAIG